MMLVPKRHRASFRERVSRALDYVRSYTLTGLMAGDKKTAEIFGFGSKTDAGIVVTARNAFTFSAVFDAVNQGSSDVGKLPLNLLKRTQDKGSEHFTDSRTYRLLKEEPNPEMSAMDMRRAMQAHAMTLGGGYAEIERDGAGRPFWLWPITPDRVEQKRHRGADGRETGAIYYLIDSKDEIPARDMIHIKGLGYDGTCGYNVIDKARQAIGLALAAEKFGASFFGDGAAFPGLLGIKGSVGPDAMTKLREHVDSMYGPGSWNRFLMIDNDPSFTSFGTDPQKAQMNELRTKQVEEVARFFNFPVHKLKNLDRATNNNIEQQDLEYYKGFMLNWTIAWEQECNRKLIPSLERGRQFVKHNFNAFLKGDTAARTALYLALLNSGVINADEVRELEDMNPQPDGLGKMFLVPLNMVPKDKIEETLKAKTAPPPAPLAPGDDDVTQADVDQANDRANKAEQIATEFRATAEAAERRVAELSGVASTSDALIAEARATATAETARANNAELLAAEVRRTADTVQQQFEAAEAERVRLACEIEAERAARRDDVQRLEAAVAAESSRADNAVAAVGVDLDRERALEARLNTTLEQQTALTVNLQHATAETERLAAELATARGVVDSAETERSALVAAHQAAIAEREAAASVLERQLAEAHQQGTAQTERASQLEADIATQRAETERLSTEFAGAEAQQRQAVADAEARATAAEAHITAASARVTELERSLEAERTARRGRVAAEVSAHRELVADIMRRMIERETDRARRHQATPEKLRQWLDSFYGGHEDLMKTALLPAVRIHLAWIGSADDPVDVASSLAARHVEDSIRQVRVILDGDADDLATSLPALLHRWETTRVTAIADHLMQKELDHVRER